LQEKGNQNCSILINHLREMMYYSMQDVYLLGTLWMRKCVVLQCEKEKRRIRTKKKEKSLRLEFIFLRGFYSCCCCYQHSYLSLVLHLGVNDLYIIQCSLFYRKLHCYLPEVIDSIGNVIAYLSNLNLKKERKIK